MNCRGVQPGVQTLVFCEEPVKAFKSRAIALMVALCATCSVVGANVASAQDLSQVCVDHINGLRGSVGLAPLARNWQQEACVVGEAQRDGEANQAHATFGSCGENGQCECPAWNGDPATFQDSIVQCLNQMWAEGPGGGHFDIMTNPNYQSVACAYAVVNGGLWVTQSYYF